MGRRRKGGRRSRRFGVAVAGDREVHGFMRGAEVARIECGFVSVEKCENTED